LNLYNKLVRDKVPATIVARGRSAVTRDLVGVELLRALRAKIDEEVSEYDAAAHDDQAAEELADLIEVIMALAKQRGFDEAAIQAIRAARADERGVFDLGHFLIAVEYPAAPPADARDGPAPPRAV